MIAHCKCPIIELVPLNHKSSVVTEVAWSGMNTITSEGTLWASWYTAWLAGDAQVGL
jgi:hypothetical protein